MPFSSDDERRLFKLWGWRYDYVKRQWESPTGAVVTTEDLVSFNSSSESEGMLVGYVMQNGQRT